MKILYVSDNRCRGNYGCRATSTALSQLIGENNTIVGHISGAFTNWNPGNLVVNKKWSEKKYIRKSKGKYWQYFSSFYYMGHRFLDKHNFFLGKHDFISYDLDDSIRQLIKCLPANPHLNEFDLRQYDFDGMVVNGEGSFIFATPAWRESMILTMLMYWAIKMGKKVYFLNAMFSDDPHSSHNDKTIKLVSKVFEQCEVVQVRENYSYFYAQKYFPNIKRLVLKPDALFDWYNRVNDGFEIKDGRYYMPFGKETDEFYYSYNYEKPYILICGSSSSQIYKNRKEAISIYSSLVERVKNEFAGYQVYLIQPCEGDDFLNEVGLLTHTLVIPMETPILAAAKIIANASLFFTGRYHPAIMASLGGTPCVFMDSNSHKTLSLQELLDYNDIREFACLPSKNDVDSMIDMGKHYLNDSSVRKRIKAKSLELMKEAKTIPSLIS